MTSRGAAAAISKEGAKETVTTSEEYATRILTATERRFGERIGPDRDMSGLAVIAGMLEHSTCRDWTDRPVEPGLVRLLCAAALSAPSKGDLQQTDIIHVADHAIRRSIVDHIDGMEWIMTAPVFLVFCGNNRRLRLMSEWYDVAVRDDVEQFLNAACDSAITLSHFLCAAEATGVGCCPVSGVRNHPTEISKILGLPDWMFPFAGMCVGYPSGPGRITPRLPLARRFHRGPAGGVAL